jgi:hypothetical protein
MRRKDKKLVTVLGIIAIFFFVLLMPLVAGAQQTWYWIGNSAGSGDWNDPAQLWNLAPGGSSTVGIPAGGDTANIFSLSAGPVTVTYSGSNYVSLSLGFLNIESQPGLGSISFIQLPGGTMNTGTLYMGSLGASGVYYNLNPGSSLTASDIYVGYSGGQGTFTQTGGTDMVYSTLSLGSSDKGVGTYNLSGTGILQATYEYVGNQGTGTFNQTGGTHTVDAFLWIGNGTYNLSGTGTLLQANQEEYVGFQGTGTFNQNGGTHTVGGYLTIATNAAGTYNLYGGTLAVGMAEYVGNSGIAGKGIFNQTGGTHTVGGSLYLGEFEGFGTPATGAYALSQPDSSNPSMLTVNGNEVIGNYGIGTFTQSGGTHTVVGSLYLGYYYNGGGTYGTGSYALSQPDSTNPSMLTVNGNEVIGNYGIGTFTQSGGTHTVVGSLYLGYYYNGGGTYGTGSYALSNGTLTVNGSTYVGYSGEGTFNQTGGTHTVALDLVLGSSDNRDGTYGNGTYNLSGTGTILQVGRDETVGFEGIGTFTQTGGTHTVGGSLYLGSYSDVQKVGPGYHGNGTYNLSGTGTILQVGLNEYVGAASSAYYAGTGAFNQTGGTHTVGGTLFIGDGGSGTYNLSGGTLTTTNLLVGINGAFNFSGGTITGALQNLGRLTNVTGGSLITPNTFAASVTNNGTFNVNNAYVTFTNAVMNNAGATFTINQSKVTFNSPVVNNGTWITDPSTIIFHGIFTGQTGTMTGSTGDTWEFLGSGANTINLGGKPINITTLVLGQGVTLNITDGSLTVNTLIDPTGTLSGITGTGAFSATNYSTLSAVPIPGAIWLLGSGLAGLIPLRRRTRKK